MKVFSGIGVKECQAPVALTTGSGPAGPWELRTKEQRVHFRTLGGSHSFVPFNSAGKQNSQLLNCCTMLNIKHFW